MEAYQLSRRSALLEAEEADVAGLQQDLKQIEIRGTALLEDLLQAGGSSSRERLSNGASRGSELREGRRRKEKARELWRRATWTVERQESARSITPESLREVLGEARIRKSSSEEERRLISLLGEHRQAAEQAVELFGPGLANTRKRGEGNPSGLSETDTRDKESTTGVDTPSAEPLFEEGLPGGQTRQDGAEMSEDPSATMPPAKALLTETREAIREARLGLEKRLGEWQQQVQGGEGADTLEGRLHRVLGRLADRDPEAASRFARCYVLEPGAEMESRTEGGIGNKSALDGEPLEGEILQSSEVQEALRRALPEGLQVEDVQVEGKRGPERKSPSHLR